MNKKIINQIVKIVSAKQNNKHKLNAGQIREMVKLIFDSLYELDLTVLLKDNRKEKTNEENSIKKISKKSKTSKKEIV
jgi:hypothetical protein